MHLVLGLFLECVQAIFALNYRSLFHEELQLSKRRVGLIAAPSCLNFDGGQDGSIRALKTMLRIVHCVVDLNSVSDTRKQVFLGILVDVVLCQLHQLEDVDVSDICTVLGQ